jgi:hypothetical protein
VASSTALISASASAPPTLDDRTVDAHLTRLFDLDESDARAGARANALRTPVSCHGPPPCATARRGSAMLPSSCLTGIRATADPRSTTPPGAAHPRGSEGEGTATRRRRRRRDSRIQVGSSCQSALTVLAWLDNLPSRAPAARDSVPTAACGRGANALAAMSRGSLARGRRTHPVVAPALTAMVGSRHRDRQ